DTGVGIAPESLSSIFNAFEQAEKAITRRFGGLGLGLAICKALVDKHGGTIEAHSTGKDHGAAFIVRLPIRKRVRLTKPEVDCRTRDGRSEQRPAGAGPASQETPRRRVLLVEDHADTARIVGRLLARRGYEVHTAGNVATALEH